MTMSTRISIRKLSTWVHTHVSHYADAAAIERYMRMEFPLEWDARRRIWLQHFEIEVSRAS
ncbi:hypothetical protein LX32DRAFT_17494 [Colletotrichum zoysiae]|uniref:Uncharacterized protein n=1 Tax=Colletotrichum zoysiae TaxID=1216348 RepID=A0AAD9LY07_9PEZI|nr:hypothetical protein LX32DRAFT_17494 [Colletotrichum zoysiae]